MSMESRKSIAKKGSSKKGAGESVAKRKPVAEGRVDGGAEALAVRGDVVGSEAAFARYLPLAQALPVAEIIPYRLDPVLAYHNVQTAISALTPHRAALEAALPLLDHKALFDSTALAQAVVFAATQVAGKSKSLGETRALLTEAGTLRALLLSTADALARAGTLKMQAVDKIRAGSGPIDQAQDLVELAALFGKSAQAMKDQRLVRAEQLERASELGTILLGRIRPGRARKKEPERADAAQVAARDQLASLLCQRYREVRKAGYYLWGDELDSHVPALQTRQRGRSKKAPHSPPTPASP
jgi:hypothetical protein